MAIVVSQPKHPEQTISAGGFFPELSLERFQQAQRVDKTFPLEQVESVLESAIARVQRAANDWVCEQVSNGYYELSGVPAAQVGDKSVLIRAYEQAVFLRAKGELIRHFSDYDLTKSGEDENQKRQSRANWYFNQASRDLRVLIGKTATRVTTL